MRHGSVIGAALVAAMSMPGMGQSAVTYEPPRSRGSGKSSAKPFRWGSRLIAANTSIPEYAFRNGDKPAGTKLARKAAKHKLGMGKPQ